MPESSTTYYIPGFHLGPDGQRRAPYGAFPVLRRPDGTRAIYPVSGNRDLAFIVLGRQHVVEYVETSLAGYSRPVVGPSDTSNLTALGAIGAKKDIGTFTNGIASSVGYPVIFQGSQVPNECIGPLLGSGTTLRCVMGEGASGGPMLQQDKVVAVNYRAGGPTDLSDRLILGEPITESDIELLSDLKVEFP